MIFLPNFLYYETNNLFLHGSRLTAHGSRLTAIAIFLFWVTLNPIYAQKSSQIPTFEAVSCGSSAKPVRNRTVETQNGEFVRILPNPASESAIVEYIFDSLDSERRLLLLNVFGQMVANVPLNEQEGEIILPTISLPSGMYYFAVTNSSVTGNLLIIH